MEIASFLDGVVDPVTEMSVLLADGRDRALLADVAWRVLRDRAQTEDERVRDAYEAVLAGIAAAIARKGCISHESIARQVAQHARRKLPYTLEEQAIFTRLWGELEPHMAAITPRIERILRDVPSVEAGDVLSKAFTERILPVYLDGPIEHLAAFTTTVCTNLARDERRGSKKCIAVAEPERQLPREASSPAEEIDELKVQWRAQRVHDAYLRMEEGAPKRALWLRQRYGNDPEQLEKAVLEDAKRRARRARRPLHAHNEAYSAGVKRMRELLADEEGGDR
jgi:hypothetical protein